MIARIKVLSVQQPHAFLMFDDAFKKDIENRTWPTKHRGALFIHASKTLDKEAHRSFLPNDMYRDRLTLHYGAIIGVVYVVDCVKSHKSTWFYGPWGFVLERPSISIQPIPAKGRLGIFSMEIDERDIKSVSGERIPLLCYQ